MLYIDVNIFTLWQLQARIQLLSCYILSYWPRHLTVMQIMLFLQFSKLKKPSWRKSSALNLQPPTPKDKYSP